MKFRIESLTHDHLEGCVSVFVAAFTKADRHHWQPADVRIRLDDLWNEPRRVGIVAIDSPGDTEALVGFSIGNFVQAADGLSLRIAELCVHPSRHGYGLGSRLLLGMEELARESGALSAYLTVQPDSVDFCQRLGYQRQEEWVSLGRRLDVLAEEGDRSPNKS